MTAWQTERLGALDRDERAALASFPSYEDVVRFDRADAPLFRRLARLGYVEVRFVEDQYLAALTPLGGQLWFWLDRKRREREFLRGLPETRN